MEIVKNVIKTSLVVIGAATATLMPTTALAYNSGAPDWSAGTMLSNGASDAGVKIRNVSSGDINDWVIGISKWIAGLAVVFFVLRVVMTAVDRMVLGNIDDGQQHGGGTRGPQQNSGFRLSEIPVIGAYDPSVSWKQVWLNFAKNLAIVAGAYLIVMLIMNVVLWLIHVTAMNDMS